jgi:hypothetical protein
MILDIIRKGEMTHKLSNLEWSEHEWPSYQAKIYSIQNAIYEAIAKDGAMTKTNLSAVHRVCHHKLHKVTRLELEK